MKSFKPNLADNNWPNHVSSLFAINKISLKKPKAMINAYLTHQPDHSKRLMKLSYSNHPITSKKNIAHGIHNIYPCNYVQNLLFNVSSTFEFISKGQNFKNLTHLNLSLTYMKKEDIVTILRRVNFFLKSIPELRVFILSCSEYLSFTNRNNNLSKLLCVAIKRMIEISPSLEELQLDLSSFRCISESKFLMLARAIQKVKSIVKLSIFLSKTLEVSLDSIKHFFYFPDRKMEEIYIEIDHQEGYTDFPKSADSLFSFSNPSPLQLKNKWTGRVGKLDTLQLVEILQKVGKAHKVEFRISSYDTLTINSEFDREKAQDDNNIRDLILSTYNQEVKKTIINMIYDRMVTLKLLENLEIDFTSTSRFHEKQLKDLAPVLIKLKSLKSFKLNCKDCANVTDIGIKSLAYAVSKLTSLEYLGFWTSGVEDICVKIFLRAILLLSKLKKLELGFINTLSSDFLIEKFIDPFQYMPNLESFTMFHTFSISIQKYFVDICQPKPAEDLKITDFEILLYVSAQKNFWSVRTLELQLGDCNKISESKIDLLINHITNHQILSKLELIFSNSPFMNDQRLEKILNWIQNLSFLDSLILSFDNSPEITDATMEKLYQTISILDNLKVSNLNFRNCKNISLKAIQNLYYLLQNKNLLQKLDFYNFKFDFSNKSLEIGLIDGLYTSEIDFELLKFIISLHNAPEINIEIFKGAEFFSFAYSLALSELLKKFKKVSVNCPSAILKLDSSDLSISYKIHYLDQTKTRLDCLIALCSNYHDVKNFSIFTDRVPQLQDSTIQAMCDFLDRSEELEILSCNFEFCALNEAQTSKIASSYRKLIEKNTLKKFQMNLGKLVLVIGPFKFSCTNQHSLWRNLESFEEFLAVLPILEACSSIVTVYFKIDNYKISDETYIKLFEVLAKIKTIKRLTYKNPNISQLNLEAIISIGKCINTLSLVYYDLDINALNFMKTDNHLNIKDIPIDYRYARNNNYDRDDILRASKNFNMYNDIEKLSINLPLNDWTIIPDFAQKFKSLKSLLVHSDRLILDQKMSKNFIEGLSTLSLLELYLLGTTSNLAIGEGILSLYYDQLKQNSALATIDLNLGFSQAFLSLDKIEHKKYSLVINNQIKLDPKSFLNIMSCLNSIGDLSQLKITKLSDALNSLSSMFKTRSNLSNLNLEFSSENRNTEECSDLLLSLKNLENLTELTLNFDNNSSVNSQICESLVLCIESLKSLQDFSLSMDHCPLTNSNVSSLIFAIWNSPSIIKMRLKLDSLQGITQELTLIENSKPSSKKFHTLEFIFQNINFLYHDPLLIVKRNNKFDPLTNLNLIFMSYVISILPYTTDLQIILEEGKDYFDSQGIEALLKSVKRLNKLQSLKLRIESRHFDNLQLASLIEIVKDNPNLQIMHLYAKLSSIDQKGIELLKKETQIQINELLIEN